MNYPTAADLRQAANEAILRRCDDPLLGEILASAASSAAEGKMRCHFIPPAPVDDERFCRISDACTALGIICDDVAEEDGPVVFSLCWS